MKTMIYSNKGSGIDAKSEDFGFELTPYTDVHTTQTFSKKETLKRPVSSLEGSITKLLTY